MSELRILVCDDQNPDAIRQDIASGVSVLDGFSVSCRPPEGNLTELIKTFFESITALLKASPEERDYGLSSDFNGHDLIVVDNNLAELQTGGARLTAEAIAGYLRVFSDTPYIVSLNKNPYVDFDLKFLLGDFETRADLALNTDHLQLAALWGVPKVGDFQPWYWPDLTEVHERRRKQIEFVTGRLDEPILGALGFPAEAVELLSDRAVSFLSPSAARPERGAKNFKPLTEITFWDHFKKSNRSLPLDERAALVLGSQMGQQERSETLLNQAAAPTNSMLRTMIARLVAAELDYWLRRDLIGPQDILLDPPHLQMRAALDEKEAPDAQSWNATAQSREAPFGLMPTAYDAVYSKHRFAHSEWLPYPGFWWPAIERDEAFLALREKYHVRSLLVFCEDTRRFQEAGSATPPERFVPEGSRPWSPRFVELVADRGYYPQSQFAA